MSQHFPTRALGANPDLAQLRRQAKDLLKAYRAGDAEALAEVNARYHDADPATFALHDAQLVIARRFEFTSWPKLKAFVDGMDVQRLAEAVRANDFEQVRAILKVRPELANIDLAENDEHRAIHYAVFNRSPEMVRLLMQHGANARKGIYPHRNATSALAIARERGYDEIVAAIEAEEQHRREAQSGSGTPVTSEQDALGMAIASGDDARALAMLEANPAAVNAYNREGYSALHVAAAVLSEPLVTWLCRHGANANLRNARGQSALDLAADMRRDESIEGFKRIAPLLLQYGAELTPRAAVALGDAAWLTARHAAGKLTNEIDPATGGLLNVAVRHRQPAILTMLLEFGFDPDERVRFDSIEEAVYTQTFALHSCASSGQYEMAETLLKYGAHPNLHVYASGSPVYAAFRASDWHMVELLKRHGGVVDPVTAGLFGAREIARQILADEAAGTFPREVLEGANAAEDLLRGSVDGGDTELVRLALAGVDWLPRDDRWYWLMMHTIWGPHIECLRLLLERCDPTIRSLRFGRTILHDVAGLGGEATAAKAPQLASLLLDAGAKLDQRDDILKSTPLAWACRWGRVELVKFLLARGADPIEADAEPWATPRAWAQKMNHPAILAVLNTHTRA